MSNFKTPWEFALALLVISGCSAAVVAPITAPIWLIVSLIFAVRPTIRIVWFLLTYLSLYHALLIGLGGLVFFLRTSNINGIKRMSYITLSIEVPTLVGLALLVPYLNGYSDVSRLWSLVLSFAAVISGLVYFFFLDD